MTALGTPFSLATASTTSRSSLLMLLAGSGIALRPADFLLVFDSAARMFITILRLLGSLFPALLGAVFPGRTFLILATRGGKAERCVIRRDTRLGDVRVGDRDGRTVLLDHDAVADDLLDLSVEPPASIQRQIDVDLHRLADEAREMFRQIGRAHV